MFSNFHDPFVNLKLPVCGNSTVNLRKSRSRTEAATLWGSRLSVRKWSIKITVAATKSVIGT